MNLCNYEWGFLSRIAKKMVGLDSNKTINFEFRQFPLRISTNFFKKHIFPSDYNTVNSNTMKTRKASICV